MFEYLHQLFPSQKSARLSNANAQTAHPTCCPPSLPALAIVSLASSSEFSPVIFLVSVLFVLVSGSEVVLLVVAVVALILVIVVEFEPAVVVFVLEMVVFVLEMVVFALEVLLFELEATVLVTC